MLSLETDSLYVNLFAALKNARADSHDGTTAARGSSRESCLKPQSRHQTVDARPASARTPLVRSSLLLTAAALAALSSVAPTFAQNPPPGQNIPPVNPPTTPPKPPSNPPIAPTSGLQPVAIPTTAPVELPTPLTLADAIDAALKLQPTIAQSVASRQASEQREKGAASRYYPTITPQYQYLSQYTFGTVNQFIPGTGGTVPVQQGSTRESKNALVGLTYNIWDSGSRDLQARQARQNLYGSAYGEENSRQTVIANVADNYFTALRNDALVKVSQAQVERAKNTLDVVKAQVEAGAAARKDVYQAEADYLNAQVTLIQAQNTSAIAQANLKAAMGLIGGTPLQLAPIPVPTENTPTTATPTAEGVPPPTTAGADRIDDTTRINQFTQVAYKLRPDLAQSQKGVESAWTSSSMARVNTGVVVSGNLSANNQFNPDTFGSTIGRNRQVNVNVSYPLFDGGLVRSNFRASQAQARATEAQYASLKQQVAVEVEQAYRTLQQSRNAIPAAEAAQKAAQINFDAASESFRQGVSSIVDVITAQTLLVQAQINYVQAAYNFYAADARLARAVGQANLIAKIGSAESTNGGATPPAGTTNPATPPPTTTNGSVGNPGGKP
jgi:outer membrane protein